jgi:hypothetical protein
MLTDEVAIRVSVPLNHDTFLYEVTDGDLFITSEVSRSEGMHSCHVTYEPEMTQSLLQDSDVDYKLLGMGWQVSLHYDTLIKTDYTSTCITVLLIVD